MHRATALVGLLITILQAGPAPRPRADARTASTPAAVARAAAAADAKRSLPRAGWPLGWLALAGDAPARECPMPVSRDGALRAVPMPVTPAERRPSARMPVVKATCANPLAR